MSNPIRPNQLPQVTTLADTDVLIADGAAGVRQINRSDFRSQLASEFSGTPASYKLAPLDGTNKVPSAYLPGAVTGALNFKGGVAGASVAATSTAAGDYYVITSAGTSQSKTWAVGDIAIYNGSSGSWTQIAAGTKQITEGGTGATTNSGARTNLDVLWSDDARGIMANRLPRPGLFCDNASSDHITGYTGLNLGVFNATIALTASASDWTPSANVTLWRSHASGNNRLELILLTTGLFRLAFIDNGGATTNYDLAPDVALVDGNTYQITVTLARGTVATLYLNGTSDRDLSGAGVTVSIAASAAVDIGNGNSNTWAIGNFASATAQRTVFYAFRVYNRALTAAQALRLAETGESGFTDQWGAFATVYSSDFSAGADTWSNNAGTTVAGNIDTITDGTTNKDDNLRITADSSSGTHIANRASLMTVGKRYRLSFNYYLPSGNAAVAALRFGTGTNSGSLGVNIDVTTMGSWTNVVAEFTNPSINGTLYINLLKADLSTSFGSANGDVAYVRDLTITEIGAVQDLDCSIGVGTFLPDQSSNRYGGVFFSTTAVQFVGRRANNDFVVQRTFLHSDISSTAATTKLLDLPPNCAVLDIELDRETGMDASTTLDFGISGTNAKYGSAANVVTTGKLLVDSLSKVSESSSAYTSVYVKKNQATTVGTCTIRVRCVCRGN